MPSEAYTDLGGQKDSPWLGVIDRPCPECGAEPEARCTFEAEERTPDGLRLVRRPRHIPCLRRVTGRADS